MPILVYIAIAILYVSFLVVLSHYEKATKRIQQLESERKLLGSPVMKPPYGCYNRNMSHNGSHCGRVIINGMLYDTWKDKEVSPNAVEVFVHAVWKVGQFTHAHAEALSSIKSCDPCNSEWRLHPVGMALYEGAKLSPLSQVNKL